MDSWRNTAMARIPAFSMDTATRRQWFGWLARETRLGVASFKDWSTWSPAKARLGKSEENPMATGDIELRSTGEPGAARKLGRMSWRVVRLPLLAVLQFVEPVARYVLTAIALLGTLVAFFLEFSKSAPRFPFWLVFGLSLGCGALVIVLNAVIRRLAR
jgi:hypothetical protein